MSRLLAVVLAALVVTTPVIAQEDAPQDAEKLQRFSDHYSHAGQHDS